MNLENEVFKRTNVNFKKLENYGFKKVENNYLLEKRFLSDDFEAIITITNKGIVSGKVIDLQVDEEYTNIRTEMTGEFVNKVRDGYRDILIDIRKNIGMAFQNPDNQIVASIVEEDVAFGMENLGLSPEVMDKRIDDALSTLGIIDSRFSMTSKLSGGQKQKVSLAGILCMQSKILVLDEPTSMIDKNGRIDLLKKVYELNKKFNITVILISHYIEEIIFK